MANNAFSITLEEAEERIILCLSCELDECDDGAPECSLVSALAAKQLEYLANVDGLFNGRKVLH